MLSAERSDIPVAARICPAAGSAPMRSSRYRGAKPQVSVRCIVAELCVFQFVGDVGEVGPCDLD